MIRKDSFNLPLQVDAVFAHAVPHGHSVDAQPPGRFALVAAGGPKGFYKLLPLVVVVVAH